MPIIPDIYKITPEVSDVKLCRYAQIINYSEWAMFGIRHPFNEIRETRQIWTKPQRDAIANALGQAQFGFEKELQTAIGTKWITDEEHIITDIITLDKFWLRDFGVRTEADVDTVAIDYATLPNYGIVTFTYAESLDELHFFIDDTDIETYPTELSVSSGTVTAVFLSARLLNENHQDNPTNGWDYTDTTIYADDLKIVRVYTNTSVPGHYITTDCSVCTITETAITCARILQAKYGTFILSNPAVCIPNASYKIVRMDYSYGFDLDTTLEQGIIRYAHTLLPQTLCAANDLLRVLWEADRAMPEAFTQERVNSPFGLQDGAYMAWKIMRLYKIKRSFYQ